eukprot:804440-Prymnesium_polylepis.1
MLEIGYKISTIAPFSPSLGRTAHLGKHVLIGHHERDIGHLHFGQRFCQQHGDPVVKPTAAVLNTLGHVKTRYRVRLLGPQTTLRTPYCHRQTNTQTHALRRTMRDRYHQASDYMYSSRSEREETCDKRGARQVYFIALKGTQGLDIRGWNGGKECRVNVLVDGGVRVQLSKSVQGQGPMKRPPATDAPVAQRGKT